MAATATERRVQSGECPRLSRWHRRSTGQLNVPWSRRHWRGLLHYTQRLPVRNRSLTAEASSAGLSLRAVARRPLLGRREHARPSSGLGIPARRVWGHPTDGTASARSVGRAQVTISHDGSPTSQPPPASQVRHGLTLVRQIDLHSPAKALCRHLSLGCEPPTTLQSVLSVVSRQLHRGHQSVLKGARVPHCLVFAAGSPPSEIDHPIINTIGSGAAADNPACIRPASSRKGHLRIWRSAP